MIAAVDAFGVVVNAIFLVAGAIMGVAFTELAKRPKLVITGNSSGRVASADPATEEYWRCSVTLTHPPSFLGINVGETMLFGRTIIPPIRIGLNIDRNTTKCQAIIADAHAGFSQGLAFYNSIGPSNYSELVEVPCGEWVAFHLFARPAHSPYPYFVFARNSAGEESPQPAALTFDKPQKFRLMVLYAHGSRRLTEDVSVEPMADGRLLISVGSQRIYC